MRKILIFLSLMAFDVVMWANGDPVAERSALTLARTPVAVHVPEVKLLDEQAFFTLHDGYVDVEVRYLLHNHSQRDFRQLPYGFPVDWLGEGSARWKSLNYVSESIVERGWRDSYVRDVMFSLDGQSLPWQCSTDTILKPSVPYIDEFLLGETEGIDYDDPLIKPDSTDEYFSAKRTRQLLAKYGKKSKEFLVHTDALCRRWYYVRLDIPAGGVMELKVRYRIETQSGRGLYAEYAGFRASEYLWCGFQYDFTPAAYWGDGLAQHFQVEVDTTDIASKGWQFERWEPKGLPFRKVRNGYRYETHNFNLAASNPLEISYGTERIHEDMTELLRQRISPERYTLRVSGVDPKYPAANLSDMDLGTAAVLRPDKKDSIYIIITFYDSTMVRGLLLFNGYCKDRQTWRNNSRIDSLDVRWTSRTCYWDTCKSDVRKPSYIPSFFPTAEPKSFTWQGLTDAAMKISIEQRKMDFDFPWEYTDYRQKTKEITLLVTGVKPGAKYNDLCVSEIIILGD